MPQQPDRFKRIISFQGKAKTAHGRTHRAQWLHLLKISFLIFLSVFYEQASKTPKVFFYLVGCLPRLTMQHELLTAGSSLNPAVWMCWGDEDFIGKVSRTSRHQHSLTCPKRTIQVSLMAYLRQWKNFS